MVQRKIRTCSCDIENDTFEKYASLIKQLIQINNIKSLLMGKDLKS